MTLSEAALHAALIEDGDTLVRERWEKLPVPLQYLGVDEKGLFIKDRPGHFSENFVPSVEDLVATDWLVLPPGSMERRAAAWEKRVVAAKNKRKRSKK